jgi:hypothetical protein
MNNFKYSCLLLLVLISLASAPSSSQAAAQGTGGDVSLSWTCKALILNGASGMRETGCVAWSPGGLLADLYVWVDALVELKHYCLWNYGQLVDTWSAGAPYASNIPYSGYTGEAGAYVQTSNTTSGWLWHGKTQGTVSYSTTYLDPNGQPYYGTGSRGPYENSYGNCIYEL